MQQLLPSPNRRFKADQLQPPMTSVMVEEGLPCLTQLAIWSALLLGIAGTALGAASFASSQQNNGLIKDYIYSPPSAPPAAVVGDQYCLEAVFANLRSREVPLWTDRPTGSAVSVPPVVYSVAGSQTTAQATTLDASKVSNLLQLLQGLHNFLPVFSPTAVLGGVVTAFYTQATSLAPTSPTSKLLTAFTSTQTTSTTETPPSAHVTVAGSLYLTPAAFTALGPTLIGYKVLEAEPSSAGVRKIVSYQPDTSKSLPQVELYLTLNVASSTGNTVSTTATNQAQSVTYDFKLSGRLLSNGKILHMITLEPSKSQSFSVTATHTPSATAAEPTPTTTTPTLEVHNVLEHLPTLYWELEEDASCGLV